MGSTNINKDGLNYGFSPVWFLNDGKKGEQLGDKLNNLFKKEEMDVDLECGTGSDMKNIYYSYVDDARGHYAGFKRLFDGTDYRTEKELTHNTTNMVANQNLQKSIGQDILSSRLYYKVAAEQYPRKIFMNDNGEFELSKPINELDVQKLKPQKPNIFKQFLHWMNDSWFEDDFDKYDRDSRSYEDFSRDFEKIKEDSKKITLKDKQQDEVELNENAILNSAQMLRDRKLVFNERIKQVLGPEPAKNDVLSQHKVFGKDHVLPDKIEYPENIPFSDNDIAMIGYAAMSDTTVCKDFITNKYLTKEENAGRMYVHVTHDIFFKGVERQGSGDTYNSVFTNARQKAKECIDQYLQGNKEPLAKLLGNAVKVQLTHESSFSHYSGLSASTNYATSKMFGLLEKDPDLLSNSGLSKEDVVSFKSHQKMAEIFTKGAEADALLIKAGKGDFELTQQEKEEALLNSYSAKVTTMMEAKDYENFQNQNSERMEQMALDNAQVVSEISNTTIQLRSMSANDPHKAELEQTLKDLRDKQDAYSTKLDSISNQRKDSPVMKMLGADNEKHPNVTELKKRIAESKTFKEWANKSVEEIRKAESGLDNSKRLDSDVAKIITEITENQLKIDNGEKTETNQIEKTEVKNVEAKNDKKELNDVQIKVGKGAHKINVI